METVPQTLPFSKGREAFELASRVEGRSRKTLAASRCVLGAFRGGWASGTSAAWMPPSRDPATRARGAVVSISGQDSHLQATYDPPSGTVTVSFRSKYFDATHTAALNCQYLATEDRLVVQLVPCNDPEIGTAVAQLYNGGRLLPP